MRDAIYLKGVDYENSMFHNKNSNFTMLVNTRGIVMNPLGIIPRYSRRSCRRPKNI